jgi:hypothetical protein
MMCCKLTEIDSLKKPSGKWCSHAIHGRGCGIYLSRPNDCREFYCDWMLSDALSDVWKPSKCKFLILTGMDGVISVLVDVVSPDAWRKSPYHEFIKRHAASAFARGSLLTVHVGRKMTIVLADREIDVGVVPDGCVVRLNARSVGGKLIYEPVVVPGSSQD